MTRPASYCRVPMLRSMMTLHLRGDHDDDDNHDDDINDYDNDYDEDNIMMMMG